MAKGVSRSACRTATPRTRDLESRSSEDTLGRLTQINTRSDIAIKHRLIDHWILNSKLAPGPALEPSTLRLTDRWGRFKGCGLNSLIVCRVPSKPSFATGVAVRQWVP